MVATIPGTINDEPRQTDTEDANLNTQYAEFHATIRIFELSPTVAKEYKGREEHVKQENDA